MIVMLLYIVRYRWKIGYLYTPKKLAQQLTHTHTHTHTYIYIYMNSIFTEIMVNCQHAN